LKESQYQQKAQFKGKQGRDSCAQPSLASSSFAFSSIASKENCSAPYGAAGNPITGTPFSTMTG